MLAEVPVVAQSVSLESTGPLEEDEGEEEEIVVRRQEEEEKEEPRERNEVQDRRQWTSFRREQVPPWGEQTSGEEWVPPERPRREQ